MAGSRLADGSLTHQRRTVRGRWTLSDQDVTLDAMTHTLSERDRAILDLEQAHPGPVTAKATQVRELFDLTPTRYAQVLNRLLEDPAALAYAPIVVHRLRGRRPRAA